MQNGTIRNGNRSVFIMAPENKYREFVAYAQVFVKSLGIIAKVPGSIPCKRNVIWDYNGSTRRLMINHRAVGISLCWRSTSANLIDIQQLRL